MPDKRKAVIIIFMLFLIVILRMFIIEPEKNKNRNLSMQIERMENGEHENDEENYKDGKFSNTGIKDNISNSSGQKRQVETLLYEKLAEENCVKSVEKSSSEGIVRYTISMESDPSDFRKVMGIIDNLGLKIYIDKIKYNKIKNSEEYSILVSIF